MQTNKIFGTLLIATIILSMTPIAIAQNAGAAEQREIQAMNKVLGAEIRLLQLAKIIDIKIEIGNKVIEKVEEQGGETAEFTAILAELELIKQEVLAADPTAENAVQQFVDLKIDAIELTQAFRTLARETLTPADAEALRAEAQTVKEQRIAEAAQIRNKVRQYNKEKLEELQDNFGIQISEIAQKIGTGELTPQEAVAQLRAKTQQMTQENRNGNYTAIKENALRNSMQARQKLEELELNYNFRYQERVQERINNMDLSDETETFIQERIQERVDKFGGAITIPGNGQLGGNVL